MTGKGDTSVRSVYATPTTAEVDQGGGDDEKRSCAYRDTSNLTSIQAIVPAASR